MDINVANNVDNASLKAINEVASVGRERDLKSRRQITMRPCRGNLGAHSSQDLEVWPGKCFKL